MYTCEVAFIILIELSESKQWRPWSDATKRTLGLYGLTDLSQLELSILTNWTSPFQMSGLFGGILNFDSIFSRKLVQQTVGRSFCGILSGSSLWFAYNPQKDSRLIFSMCEAFSDWRKTCFLSLYQKKKKYFIIELNFASDNITLRMYKCE